MTHPSPLEISTCAQPENSIIWLHGLGADGHDFVPIVEQLEQAQTMPLRFVFPHAPMLPVTINAGYVMPAWYDITHPSLELGEDEAGIRASQQALEQLIEREKARGIPASRIVLAGFSQGGVIALQTALRYRERLAGALILSAYLALKDTLAAEASAANRDMPIFMAHGSRDTVVAPAYAARSREALYQSGYAVEWHEYDMGHAVCDEEISAIDAWLMRVLGASD